MEFEDDRDERRRRPASAPDDSPDSQNRRTKAKKSDAPEVGDALRSIYDSTLKENIPPEMLDLLGKLG